MFVRRNGRGAVEAMSADDRERKGYRQLKVLSDIERRIYSHVIGAYADTNGCISVRIHAFLWILVEHVRYCSFRIGTWGTAAIVAATNPIVRTQSRMLINVTLSFFL